MNDWLKVLNKADSKESEVLLYGSIGNDPWDEHAVSFGQFREAWSKIPTGHRISLRINSLGGSVWDGIPIHNLVAQRRADVVAHVEGIAASIASVIAMAAGRVVMPKQAEIFIHEPWAGASGDAAVMTNMAERLNFLGDQVADIYAAKAGKTREEMRALMKAGGIGTSFLGQAAKEFGLVDEITDAEPMKNEFDLSRFRRVPSAATGGVEPPPTEPTPKQKVQLMEPNATPAPTAEAPPSPAATPPSNVIDVAEFNRLKAELAAEKRARTIEKLNGLASERDINPDDWIDDAVANPAILNRLEKLPTRGRDPVQASKVIVGYTEPSEPKNATEAGDAYMRITDPKAQAEYYIKHRDKVCAAVFNHSRIFKSPQAANTFTTLTHTLLGMKAMEAFLYTIQPLRALNTNFSAEAVNPGDKVKVKFVSSASAALSFAGTYLVQGVTAEGKDITIDKRPYVSWGITTEELMTLPQVKLEDFARVKGNALALAVVQDIFSLITEANYGSGAIATNGTDYVGDQIVEAAADFDLDTVAAAYGACGVANWPVNPRSMVLSIPYYTRIFRESEVVGTEGLASSNPTLLREAEIRRLMGFDLYETNCISATATDNVTGFVCHPDAIMIAGRTLIPESGMSGSPAVRVFTDPALGISIVQREWFNPENDQAIRVLECNYGRAVGNADALITIVSS